MLYNNMSLIVSDFILLIFNCEKYRFKADRQKKTWLKDLNSIPYFHVLGHPHLLTDYEFDIQYNILYVKTEDDYNSLPKKVIAAYEAVYNECTFKYILKTDDDQNLINIHFLHTITNILSKAVPQIHYAGNVVDIKKPHYSQYHKIHPELPENLPILQTQYCSGRFYALSNLAVQQLISKKELISQEYFEDYAIGYHLDQVLKYKIFNIQTNKYFIDFQDKDYNA